MEYIDPYMFTSDIRCCVINKKLERPNDPKALSLFEDWPPVLFAMPDSIQDFESEYIR